MNRDKPWSREESQRLLGKDPLGDRDRGSGDASSSARAERAEIERLLREQERDRSRIEDLRHQVADQEVRLAHARLWQEGGAILGNWILRYHRVFRSLGWTPPEDEVALHQKILDDLARQR